MKFPILKANEIAIKFGLNAGWKNCVQVGMIIILKEINFRFGNFNNDEKNSSSWPYA